MLERKSMYSRPDKPLFISVVTKKHVTLDVNVSTKETIPAVDKRTECHVTPPEVCQRMIDYAEIDKCDVVIEPQFGTGNIIYEMLNAGVYSNNIIGIERNIDLFGFTQKRLEKYDLRLINDCFLNYAKSAKIKADKIIFNPPFSKCLKHFEAALSCLKPGGVAIALVPTSFNYDGAVKLEDLPETTFSTTKVLTKIIAFYK